MADPVGSFLVLAGMVCVFAASYAACYAIWSAGWEGWESWHARTGLDEHNASLERFDRLSKGK